MSDVVGTLLMLAATVALVAASVPFVMPASSTREPAPALVVTAEGRANGTQLRLLHVGGPAWPLADLRIVVATGNATLFDARAGNGTWRLGDALDIALASPLPRAGDVHVLLLSAAAQTALAEPTLVRLPELAARLPAPSVANVTVTIHNGTDLAYLNRSAVFVLEAAVVHPDGRTAIARVVANLTTLGQSPEALLHDDGTNGDLVAGDAVWSTVVDSPLADTAGVANLNVTAYALDGSTASGDADFAVMPVPPIVMQYNASMFSRVGWSVTKVPTNLLDVRLKVVTTGTTVKVNGLDYRLTKVYLQYLQITGDKSQYTFADSPCAPPMGVFGVARLRVDHYKSVSNAFQYYFRTEWTGPAGSPRVYANVEPAPPLQYFILRASEASQNVGTAWTSYTDCTTSFTS